MYHSILPGKTWLDTDGKRIQAHGGSVLYRDGIYYWYGENKEKTTGKNGIWHWGVRCYASRDLYNWEDKGLIIPPEPENPASSLHPASMMDRPHIIYNKDTKKYVSPEGSCLFVFKCYLFYVVRCVFFPYPFVCE